MSDLDWLAGLLEGEGSFYRGRDGTITVSVHMTDQDIVQRVARIFGTSMWLITPEELHHKASYSTRLRGRRAAKLMMQLRPLMGERRRQQIDTALDGPIPLPRATVEHGSLTMYRRGCRCWRCKRRKHQEYLDRKPG